MMRVAHILSYFPGQEGLTSFCRGLGRAFEGMDGVEVPVISFRAKPPREVRDDEPPVISFPFRGRHPFELPPAFLRALDTGELVLDGAVLHGTYSPQASALARALKKRGIPYIFIPHDPYVKELRRHHGVRKFVYWHLFEKRMIAGAAAVQLLAQDHERALREVGVTRPCFTIGNGCDPRELEFVPEDAREPGKGEDFVIQYLGRMDRNHKGLDLLLEGFAKFLERAGGGKEIRLVLSGNDWVDRPFLEALAEKLGITANVVFTGRLKDRSIAVHSRADLSVLCSRFDGFGLTIVEAMLAGRPVLVSRRAGIAEHLEGGDLGFLVDPEAGSIADGLWEAWRKREDLAVMGAAARRYVIDHLTWEMVAEKSHHEYRRLFAGEEAGKVCD